MSFPVSVGGSIGNWYPPTIGYIGCSSVRCEKVVHNAVMSLVCMPFHLVDAFYLHKKAQREPIPTRPNLCAKIVQVLASLGYLIFYTVLFDMLLIGLESHTLYKTMTRVEVDVFDGSSSRFFIQNAWELTREGRFGRVKKELHINFMTEGFLIETTFRGTSSVVMATKMPELEGGSSTRSAARKSDT
jgi:hypothetical protein